MRGSVSVLGEIMANLPYVTATGNVARALKAIAAAATPDNVTQNFVQTMLKIPGGSGTQMTSFLKKIGFANPDGTPTDIYRRFRNEATRGRAAAESLKFGYAPLYRRNEFLHELSDKDLKGLILEETGLAADSNVPSLILSCIKAIKQFADFKDDGETSQADDFAAPPTSLGHPIAVQGLERSAQSAKTPVGLSLGYNIHLNLPATTDIAVFNAIFKSLKDNLLSADDV
jgi:hypothetical protein